jgi:hypothetical protein
MASRDQIEQPARHVSSKSARAGRLTSRVVKSGGSHPGQQARTVLGVRPRQRTRARVGTPRCHTPYNVTAELFRHR